MKLARLKVLDALEKRRDAIEKAIDLEAIKLRAEQIDRARQEVERVKNELTEAQNDYEAVLAGVVSFPGDYEPMSLVRQRELLAEVERYLTIVAIATDETIEVKTLGNLVKLF